MISLNKHMLAVMFITSEYGNGWNHMVFGNILIRPLEMYMNNIRDCFWHVCIVCGMSHRWRQLRWFNAGFPYGGVNDDRLHISLSLFYQCRKTCIRVWRVNNNKTLKVYELQCILPSNDARSFQGSTTSLHHKFIKSIILISHFDPFVLKHGIGA